MPLTPVVSELLMTELLEYGDSESRTRELVRRAFRSGLSNDGCAFQQLITCRMFFAGGFSLPMRYADGSPAETVHFHIKSMIRRYDLSDMPYLTASQAADVLFEPTKPNFPHIDRVVSNSSNAILYCFQDSISPNPFKQHLPDQFFASLAGGGKSAAKLIGDSPERPAGHARASLSFSANSEPDSKQRTSHALRWLRRLRCDDSKTQTAPPFDEIKDRPSDTDTPGLPAPQLMWVLISPLTIKEWTFASSTRAFKHYVRIVLREDLVSSKLLRSEMWNS